VPHTGRREDTIPEIELGLRKSGMGTQNAIDQARVVFTLLFPELIPCAEQEELRKLEIMLPLQAIGKDTRFIRRSERRADESVDKAPL